MTSSTACGVCSENYNEEERCPRILPCIHFLCTLCIKRLIARNEKKCPFCRQVFKAKSAQDVKISSSFLELLRYLQEVETKSSLLANGSGITRARMIEDFKKKGEKTNHQNIIYCEASLNRVKKSIDENRSHKAAILQNQTEIKTDLMRMIKYLEENCEMKLKFLDYDHERLKIQLRELQERRQHLGYMEDKLKEVMTIQSIDSIIDEVEETNASVQTWIQNFEEIISVREKSYQEIQKNTDKIQSNINSMRDLQNTLEPETDIIEQMVTLNLLESSRKTEILETDTLQLVKQMANSLLNRGLIYAVHTQTGRSAKFSFTKNNLFLHHLRQQEIPKQVCKIEHSEVMKLAEPSHRICFLEFGTDNSTLGPVLIRLTPDTKRAENFYVMCSGEQGASYANTIILFVRLKGNAGECIACGDYNYNNGNGGEELVLGAGKEKGGALIQPRALGIVSGLYYTGGKASQFYITTRESSYIYDTVFGKVESGMNILKGIIDNFPNIKNVKIKDCGLVL